ncbi:MAG TPA: TetR/AcrR family transcriptional regulator [Steroidobacteraceae bacterium]|nr:TetR/AcrR family transcriptional regulator [Steroidobacteraceae bacterium]
MRTKPPEQRRRELMNAAQRLFLEHGVGPVTIEQITSSAAVAKGTFYLYFSSKDDLLGALRKRFAEQLLARIRSAIAKRSQAHWKERLSAWAKAIIAGYLDSMRLHDILFYASRPLSREGLIDNIIIDDLYHLLETGVAAGAWSIDDPRFTAVFLFSGVHGVVEEACAKHKKVNRVRLARRLERLCFRAVGLPIMG